MTELGTTIRRMRKEKKLTIRKLAELSGVSHPYLSQLENGRNDNPSPAIIGKIARGLRVEYVEGYETEESRERKALRIIAQDCGMTVDELVDSLLEK